MTLHFRVNPETLREIVDDRAALDGRIAALASSGVADPGVGVSAGADPDAAADAADSGAFDARCEYVSLLRIAGRLDEAALEGELTLASADLAGDLRKMTRAMLILGHVRQWRREWEAADVCFGRATRMAFFLIDDTLTALAAQHSGRNFFDQGDFVEAAIRFRLALEIRRTIGAPSEEVAASLMALAAALEQL